MAPVLPIVVVWRHIPGRGRKRPEPAELPVPHLTKLELVIDPTSPRRPESKCRQKIIKKAPPPPPAAVPQIRRAVRRRGLRRAAHQRRVRDLVLLSGAQGRADPHPARAGRSRGGRKIGQFIKEIESQLGWTTQLPWSASTLEQRRFDALRLLRQVPAITELAQLDPTGKEQLRVSRLAMDVVGSGLDFSKDPKFTEAVAKKVYYGPVYFRRESEPYMTLALAGTRRDAGVSVAEVNLKLIWDVVSQIKVGERGQAYVVDAQGRLIAHPDISLVLRNTDMSRLPQVQAARNAARRAARAVQEARDIAGPQGADRHAPVAPLGWIVFVELPVEEAYAPLYESIQRSAWLLLARPGLACSPACSWRAAWWCRSRRCARAPSASAAATSASASRSRPATSSKALADQFNDMAGKLQESYADLESKVEERTRELAQSVAELRALGEVSQAVNSTLDLETVLSTIVSKAAQLSGTEAGAIYVFNEATANSDCAPPTAWATT